MPGHCRACEVLALGGRPSYVAFIVHRRSEVSESNELRASHKIVIRISRVSFHVATSLIMVEWRMLSGCKFSQFRLLSVSLQLVCIDERHVRIHNLDVTLSISYFRVEFNSAESIGHI